MKEHSEKRPTQRPLVITSQEVLMGRWRLNSDCSDFLSVCSGCAGSSLLRAGFLQLWRVGAALPAVPGLLVAAASLAVEHRL